MTPDEITMARALGACGFRPGSWDKRFARAMVERAADRPLSRNQVLQLCRLVHKYRRQIAPRTVALAEARVLAIADAPIAPPLPAQGGGSEPPALPLFEDAAE